MNESIYGITVEAKPKAREIFPYSDNGTASYVPNKFLGTGTLSLAKKYCHIPVEEMIVSSTIKATKKALKDLTESLKDDLMNAAETRFQLYFHTLLLARNTNFVFTKCFTEGQAGVKSKKSEDVESELKLVEAHASTNPSLLYTTAEDEMSELIDPASAKPRIFDGANENHHLTHKFPKFVNQVDLLIDEQKKPINFKFRSFRVICIDILNHCSRGKMTIQQAFAAFLSNFVFITDKLSKEKLPEHHQQVVNFYHNTALRYLAKKEDVAFWKSLSFSQNRGPITELVFETIQRGLLNNVSRHIRVHGKYMELRQLCNDFLVDENTLKTAPHQLDDIIMCVVVQNIELNNQTHDFAEAKDECNDIGKSSVVKYARDCFLTKSVRDQLTTYLRKNYNKIIEKGVGDIDWTAIKFGWIAEAHVKNQYGIARVNSLNAICLRLLFDIQCYSRYKLNGEFLRVCQFFNLGPMEIYNRFDLNATAGKNAYACMENDEVRAKAREFISILSE